MLVKAFKYFLVNSTLVHFNEINFILCCKLDTVKLSFALNFSFFVNFTVALYVSPNLTSKTYSFTVEEDLLLD